MEELRVWNLTCRKTKSTTWHLRVGRVHSHQSLGQGISETGQGVSPKLTPQLLAAQALWPWQVLGAVHLYKVPPERIDATLSLLEAQPEHGQGRHHAQLHLPVSTAGHRAAAVPAGAQGSAEPDIHLQVLASLKGKKPPCIVTG